MKLSFKGTLLAAGLVIGCAVAKAAPQLRLTASALGPVVIAQGSNGPPQTVNAGNIGDGTLSPQVTASDSWLVPTVGASTSCQIFGTCLPVSIALQTSSLANGVYTGTVTVSDPSAIDAPQTITVTVQIGSGVPSSSQTLYAPPNGKATFSFSTASPVTATSSASWLSVAVNGSGTFQFAVPYLVTANAAGLSNQQYNGQITITGSTLSSDNTRIPVVFNVTTSPIAQPSSQSLSLTGAQNTINQTAGIFVGGQGVKVGTVTATPASGTWLTATASGNNVTVTANPTGLSPGPYTGTVSIASNAANSPNTIPVQFVVEPQTAPVVGYGGVVNNATFTSGEAVAPGDIMALFGTQLLFSEPVHSQTTPLPTSLSSSGTPASSTEVLVNGQPVPLYFTSYGQVDFQLPFGLSSGRALVQVVRDGQTGNSVAVEVIENQPRILPFSNGYGIVQNATQGGYALSKAAGAQVGVTNAKPAKAGTDFLTIYAIGVGPVSPPVATGDPAPVSPLAKTTLPTSVLFSTGNPLGPVVKANASFSGLTPFLVGLYQVNVKVPADSPKGDPVVLSLVNGTTSSNLVNITVE